ncbi:hypothetical protein ACI782_23310 [Geodermatophilus sp. SYSU D00703]
MAERDAGGRRSPEDRPRRLPRHYRRIRPGYPAPRDGDPADRRPEEGTGDDED